MTLVATDESARRSVDLFSPLICAPPRCRRPIGRSSTPSGRIYQSSRFNATRSNSPLKKSRSTRTGPLFQNCSRPSLRRKYSTINPVSSAFCSLT
jgi:hypothetical protein